MRRASLTMVVVVVVLLVVLAGCGGGGGGSNTTTGNSGGGGATTGGGGSTSGGGGGGQSSGSSQAASASKGKSLFSSLGCQSCHSISGSSGVGPALNGVAGSKVTLDNGKTVTADDGYLVKSIRQPDAEVVKGYQKGVMSSTIKPGSVSTSDAQALVAYIKTLK